MPAPPKISVATVTRNNLKELRATVASVLSQKRDLYEYLVIDGASTDGTRDFLTTLDASRVRWTSEDDGGIAEAFNKAQAMANGEMIIFMNAGDTFVDAATLETFWNALPPGVEKSAVVAYGDYIAVSGASEKRFTTDHRELQITNSINHQSAFIGRQVYQKFLYDGRLFLGMDYDYWLRCLEARVPFVKVPVPVARFMLGGRSSSLDYRVHTALIRYFLRALNERRVFTTRDAWSIFMAGMKVSGNVWLRRLAGQGSLPG